LFSVSNQLFFSNLTNLKFFNNSFHGGRFLIKDFVLKINSSLISHSINNLFNISKDLSFLTNK